ncbi:MAG: SpoIIE family protein phosphatase, partial [Abditibacteriaceae bacterium]
MACAQPDRYGLRRWLIVAMDMMLITLWIHVSGQWNLFAFYYLVVVVAAMWFRVAGGVLAAILCDFFFLFLWLRMAGNPAVTHPPGFTNFMALHLLLLLLIGCLVGYIAEIQERERQARLESQELVDNYQREIELSSQLQPLLADKINIDRKALEIGSATATARPFGGGDYIDCITLPDGRISLCIADVSGKSVRAQARLPLFKYALRALAPLHKDAGELMVQLNAMLLPDLQPELYITACYVIIDTENKLLNWCNAGHVPPLLCAENNITELPASGPALGMFAESTYQSSSAPWQPNDCLLLYTDGLTDAIKTSEDDTDKLQSMWKELITEPTLTIQEMVDVLLGEAQASLKKDALSRKQKVHPQNWEKNVAATSGSHLDDITLLLAKRVHEE